MVRIRVSMVIFFAAFAAVGQGQTMDPVTESFDVSGTPEIVVQNEDGKTVVASHAASTVEVVATKVVSRARDAAEAAQLADAVEVRIERRGDRIEVRTIYPDRRRFSWKDASVRVDIQVRTPRNSNLDLTSEDGALTVEGIEGVIRVNVEDGDLRVSDCAGELRIEADRGLRRRRWRLESVRGPASSVSSPGGRRRCLERRARGARVFATRLHEDGRCMDDTMWSALCSNPADLVVYDIRRRLHGLAHAPSRENGGLGAIDGHSARAGFRDGSGLSTLSVQSGDDPRSPWRPFNPFAPVREPTASRT